MAESHFSSFSGSSLTTAGPSFRHLQYISFSYRCSVFLYGSVSFLNSVAYTPYRFGIHNDIIIAPNATVVFAAGTTVTTGKNVQFSVGGSLTVEENASVILGSHSKFLVWGGTFRVGKNCILKTGDFSSISVTGNLSISFRAACALRSHRISADLQ